MRDPLIFGLVFASAVFGSLGVLRLVFGDERQMSKRLRSVSEYLGSEATEDSEEPATRKLARGAATKRFSRRVRDLWPRQYRDKARVQLSRVGRVTSADVDRFLSSKMLYGASLSALMILLALGLGWNLPFGVIMVAGAGAGGLLLPDSRLRESIKKRQRQMLRELPDVLDMLTISVTAGLGFEAAIQKLVKNSDGLVVNEFERMLKEVNAGASRKQAMRAMAERVDSPEMSVFVSAIVQAESFGTPIAAVLRVQAGELRNKRRQRAEEEAQKAPVMMTIPLMLIILPATILVLLGPALMSLSAMFR